MANNSPFTAREVVDQLFTVQDGVNMGISPLLLAKTQLAAGTNVTVRGTILTQRPPFQLISLGFTGSPTQSQQTFLTGNYQGGGYFKPDVGFESMLFQIGGRLFQITPGATTASFQDVTIPGNTVGGAGPNPASAQQVWMWQSEKWMIIMDGSSIPIFFDQTANPPARRSTWGQNTYVLQDQTTTTSAVVPAVGVATGNITLTDASQMSVNDQIWFNGIGQFTVQTVVGNVITAVNVTGTPGKTIAIGTLVAWNKKVASTELPPGGMGAYGTQNWFALPDFKQFTASDQVGDASGTLQNNFRDAVLHISRNTFLVGGGNFVVPGTAGELKAFVFVPTLDASLGQGPLQVLTPTTAFSVNVPTDFLTWQSVTNPILTESLIGYGALGQWSTVVCNSDIIMRSAIGISSLILARRDFNTWGNVPISREVNPITSIDPQSILTVSSSVVFDNRLLTTAQAVIGPNGVYWQQLIALNLDPVSTLRGKAASVYDGSWTGLNVFQLIKGAFSGIERCFAMCFNATTGQNELYEILKTGAMSDPNTPILFDNQATTPTRITSISRTAVMLKDVPGKTAFDLCRLVDGEIYVDSISGTTDIQVWYKPDSYPCWIAWTKFSLCTPVTTDDPQSKMGYRTRIGLGEPSGKYCEPTNNRPFRVAYWMQFRFVQTGPGRIVGFRAKAVLEPQPQFAPPAGCCEGEVVYQIVAPVGPPEPPPTSGTFLGNPDAQEILGDPLGGFGFGIPGS